MIQVLRGHTYAIGMQARAVDVRSDIQRSATALGYAVPDGYIGAGYAAAGWNPVVIYPEREAPIQNPGQRADWIAIAGRTGGDFQIQGYAGEITALSVFGPWVLWVIDLGGAPVARSLVADPAPDSPTWRAVEADAAPAAPPAARPSMGGGFAGVILGGIAGAVLGAQSTRHPVALGVGGAIAGALVGGTLGGAIGAQ